MMALVLALRRRYKAGLETGMHDHIAIREHAVRP